MRRISIAALIPLLLIPRLASPQGEPLGPEFRVNPPASLSSVASAGGDFVVVWTGSDANQSGIRGQRYDSAGNPLGTEFQVNTYTPDSQAYPAVGADASGAFVVVWQSVHLVTPEPFPLFEWSLFGQRYAPSGAPVGTEFRVNGPLGDEQRPPAIAVAPSGAFLIVWSQGLFQAPPGPFDIYARRYDSSGVPQGPEFRVNTYWTGSQLLGFVAADPAGNFVVVWSGGYFDVTWDVFGQRYAASGDPLGPEFRVNTDTAGQQFDPAVATDVAGNFVVAWGDAYYGYPQPKPIGVFGQRFASSGAPVGPEYRVNTNTTGFHRHPDIAVDGSGNFVIAWHEAPTSGTGEVLAQRYSSLGEPSGPEFRVNTTIAGWQRNPSVASTPGGTFLVTWDSGPANDVFGQRFGGIFPVKLQDFRVE